MASAVASSLSVSDIAMSEKERIHSSEGEGLVEMGKSTPRREEDNVVTYHMIQVILLGSFGGFLFGYDLALIGGALIEMHKDFDLSDFQKEAIVGCAKVGAIFGVFLGAVLMHAFGRRQAIEWTGLFFILGPSIMTVAPMPWVIMVGRWVVGVGVGMSAVVVPQYTAELAATSRRGQLTAVFELVLCFGMLASTLVNTVLSPLENSWRWMVVAPVVPALVLVVGARWLPESPRWLVTQGRLEDAMAVLHLVRTDVRQSTADRSTPAVEKEALNIWLDVQAETWEVNPRTPRVDVGDPDDEPLDGDAAMEAPSRSMGPPQETTRLTFGAGEASLVTQLAERHHEPHVAQVLRGVRYKPRQLLAGASVRTRFLASVSEVYTEFTNLHLSDEKHAFWLVMGLAVFDQITASTAIINYTPQILSSMGEDDQDAVMLNVLMGLTKGVGVCFGMLTVDRVGRRILLIAGGLLMAGTLFMLSIVEPHDNVPLTLGCLCCALLFFSASWAIGFWIIVSEMFSMKRKSAAASVTTAMLFATGALVDFTFLTLVDALGSWAYILFGLLSSCSALFVVLCLPETKGCTLLQVQDLMAQRQKRSWWWPASRSSPPAL